MGVVREADDKDRILNIAKHIANHMKGYIKPKYKNSVHVNDMTTQKPTYPDREKEK